ncbi:MAG TPA: hypothetical protein EYP78_02160 [Candidatus Omnitrophica bacterium]|nr:hypothetical protein [Candidatus Omnitrophota bacterium]
MPKITFIGSGSLGFTRRLITDILSFPELQESDFSLIDIDEKRLDYSLRITRRVLRDGNYPATVEATLDRKKALQGAEYVIITILVGGIEAISLDVDIPMKYGVDQCIGDTLGPGGVLRGIRTIPVILEICRDIEDVCPTAIVFNYTNPMAMLCWAMNEATSVKNVGLCHSVQGTAKELAHYIQASPEEISYWVAGINHQSWFLEFKWNGKDAYPLLREKMKDAEVIRTDPTRFEMFKHLGYFVTESSGHNSEYNPWFRKRKDLLEKYTGKGFNGESRYIKQLYGKDREEWDKELEKLINQKSH